MAQYKYSGDGIHDVYRDLYIPVDEDNPHYQEFIQWELDGGVPDPEFTPEEITERSRLSEILSLKTDLERAMVWQFRMIMALYDVGNTKGIWDGTDFDQEIKDKVASWKTKSDRLRIIDE